MEEVAQSPGMFVKRSILNDARTVYYVPEIFARGYLNAEAVLIVAQPNN